MNSTWLITSKLANQRARKVLINTVLLTYQQIHQELEELQNQHNIVKNLNQLATNKRGRGFEPGATEKQIQIVAGTELEPGAAGL